MPALAKIQPKRVNLLELINGSLMSEDRKEYWREAIPGMTMAEKGELAKMLLDERDRITEQDSRAIAAEAKLAEKSMWRSAEERVRNKDERNADKILDILANA